MVEGRCGILSRIAQKAWLVMGLTIFVLISGCNVDVGGSSATSGGALEAREANPGLPWGPGEDCRNWGCGEDAASQAVLPLPSNAQTCSSNGECTSGFCVDGVCCDSACTGTCMACTAAKKGQGADGTCGAIVLYGDPDNECPDAACDGTGKCKSYNGVTCSSAITCLSGNCVDGYCCGAACTGTCMACSIAKRGSGYNGQCGPIATNTDPDNECMNSDCNGSGACTSPTNLLNGNPCTASAQCASGYCVDGFCCGNACTDPCKSCSAAKKGGGYNGQCGFISANTDPDNECVGGDCNGTGACTTPQLQANGTACSASTQCSSGFCVDGVCCDKACTSTCEACTAAKKFQGADGTCGFIASGKNPDGECQNGICNGAGVCKGYNGATCTTTTQCLSGYCVDGYCCGAACTETCRACSAAKKGGGVNGQCGAIAVNTDPDNECSSDCNGAGACLSLLANGSACSTGSQCSSTFCVDGVCCDRACSGTCEACSASKKGSGANGTCGFIAADTNPDNECVSGKCGGLGTCKYYNGVACSVASQCMSNYCVDGVCCGAACTGTCQACSVAKKGGGIEGQCGNIGTGLDPDGECGGGACDGVSGCFGGTNGSSCSSDAQCLSGHCVDGVCCDTACTATCMACDVSGSEGICSNVPLGQTDPNAATPCAGICDGEGTCKTENGGACSSGIQCSSRVCDDGTCAAATPPQPLAWMTVLSDVPMNGAYFDMQAMETSASGGMTATGRKYGRLELGGTWLNVCCWLAGARLSFDDAGFPTAIADWWMNDFNNEYLVRYAPQRYDNVAATRNDWHSGPAYSMSTFIDAPMWNRVYGQTALGTFVASDQGHLLISATISRDDQNNLNPVDFGDGNLVTDARLVKYDPAGQVVFNVPSVTLTVGSVMDPNGAFYDFARASGSITITKQDSMGNALWMKSYSAGVAAGVTPVLAQAFDEQGNIFLAFNFQGVATFDMTSMTSTGIHDLGLAKLDQDGNALWLEHFGTATFDLQTIHIDPTGSEDFVLRGTFVGTADFGQGAFTSSPFLAKFDATGTLVWQAPAPTGTFSVRGSESGAVFVASSSDTCDFGWGAPLAGETGIIVAKYGPCADPAQCRPAGSTCVMNSQCDSGFCVDGYCCDAACSGLCEACSAVKKGNGSNGICGPIANGADPDDECNNSACSGTGVCAQVNGVPCTAGAECLSGYCVDGVCCGGACSGQCQACTAAKKGNGSDGGCGNIAAGTDPDDECGTGTCGGAGTCTMASTGVTCTAGNQCASGFCVDGVCCTSACTGTCQACTAAKKGSGADGTCGTITAFSDPDNECAQGTCNGSGACAAGANGNPCATTNDCTSGFCADGVCCTSACAGLCQACTSAKKGSGSDGTCGSIALNTDPENECTNGACSGSGTCQADVGIACSSPSACLSGHCIDGVCCDTACTGLCQACSVIKKGSGFDGVCGSIAMATDPDNECASECNGSGACQLAPNGASCPDASQCASGFCVDGVCCDSACTGTCQACSAAKKGTGSNGQCGMINAGQDPDNECVATCDGSGGCTTPPVLLADGAACTGGAQCNSGHCISGICCNTSCYETCRACNLPGLAGTCSETSPGACTTCGGILGHTNLPIRLPYSTDIAIADLNNDGILDMATVGSSANAVQVNLGLGNGAFETYGTYTAGAAPQRVDVADLNGDQTLDVVATNTNDNTVSVLLNLGDATFAPKVDYATGTNPRDVMISDFNGDGFKDIVVGNYASNTISMLAGNGTGAFAPKVDSVISGLKPNSIAAADFTGDGVLDLAVTNSFTSLQPRLWVLRGLGNGTFVFLGDYPVINQFADSFSWCWVVARDFDGDGQSDIAVATDTSSAGDTRVLFNQGGGVFGNEFRVSSQGLPSTITAGDFNGDGQLDVAWGTADRAYGVHVLLNAGARTFNRTFYGSGSIAGITSGDVDGDGDSDLVAGVTYGTGVFLNAGNGTFDNDDSTAYWNTLSDLNGDGKLDAVVVRYPYPNYTLSVHLNQGNNTFASGTVYGANPNLLSSHVVDVNGDNRPDLVYTNPQSSLVAVHLNNGSGVFGAATNYATASTFTGVEVADVTGDDKPDLIMLSSSTDLVSVRFNNGNGTFGARTDYATGDAPSSVAIVDLTGDGKRDIATTNGANTLSILRNNGNGTFAAKVDYPTGTSPTALLAADVNDDNIVDFVLHTSGPNFTKNIEFALNQGNGTFALLNYATAVRSDGFVVTDLNGDGKPDTAVANRDDSTGWIDVRLNLGNGMFGAMTKFFTRLTYSDTLGASDINGDGRLDLHQSFGVPRRMNVLFNYGGGTFGPVIDYATGARMFADLDGDGVQDTIRADASSVSARFGACIP